MYERENCWPADEGGPCSEKELTERVIVNPIYNYQAIKRLVVVFKEVEKAAGSIDVKSKSIRVNCTVHTA